MEGHILDGHGTGQVQGIAFEGPRVLAAWVGETQLDLPRQAAVSTVHPRHRQLQQHRLATDGHRLEKPLHAALAPHVVRTTDGTAVVLAWLLESKGHPTAVVRRA